MGDIADLKPPVPLENDELVEDLARFADGTLSETQVRARHRIADKDWLAMGESDELVRLVEAAKLRRIRTGATKRELAQIEIVAAPPLLGKIMREAESPRHVIDASKVLDGLATGGAEAAAAGQRFEITINLGSDLDGRPVVEHYSKSVAIDPNDIDPTEIDPNIIAAISTKKLTGGGDGGHL